MKTSLHIAVSLSALCTLHSAFSQGSLTPPGPPAPAMKTLAQIEPRTPISSLPFTISAPGSYYVTTNLTGPGGPAGITVAADDVTIDLNGFFLAGLLGGGNSAIGVSGTHTNLTVRNGSLRDWDSYGVATPNTIGGHYERLHCSRIGLGGLNVGNDSLVLDSVIQRSPTSLISFAGILTGTGCVVRNCVVFGSAGIGIQAGGGSTVSSCTVEYPIGTGISVGTDSIVTGCAVNSGAAVGIAAAQQSSVLDCNAGNNSASGISAGYGATIRNCTANFNGGAGIALFDAGVVQNCTTRQNSNHGIAAGNSSTVSGSTAVANTNIGILVGNGATVSHCTLAANLNGILTGNNCTIIACSSSLNSSNGIFAALACSIKDCNVSSNSASGIRASSYCLISGNLANRNAVGLTNNANIYVTADDNQIMDNNATFGGPGIKTDSGYNLIVKNKATVNNPNFDLAPGGVAVPISSNPTNAGPWSNFSF
ncbi:MAG TPA: right-handed parallel beta-helix repeat-containing protein [Candidatus Binatia bacterium]|jgi:hypothetical protein|nr:right-handed parallel beta-helix repeat-containing protein [Candidatus Binatia bacterium]